MITKAIRTFGMVEVTQMFQPWTAPFTKTSVTMGLAGAG